jgi:hypothetical protein
MLSRDPIRLVIFELRGGAAPGEFRSLTIKPEAAKWIALFPLTSSLTTA